LLIDKDILLFWEILDQNQSSTKVMTFEELINFFETTNFFVDIKPIEQNPPQVFLFYFILFYFCFFFFF